MIFHFSGSSGWPGAQRSVSSASIASSRRIHPVPTTGVTTKSTQPVLLVIGLVPSSFEQVRYGSQPGR
jgi:hypothetical protein